MSRPPESNGWQHNPKLNAMLKALGLDVYYHKGEGNTLYYYDDQQHEVAVSDFLGGYGSCLFGHNHPRLMAVAKNCLDNSVPFFTQASHRRSSGDLAASLQNILRKQFNRSYQSVFASTGAEAVEIAIKHATFAYFNKLLDRPVHLKSLITRKVVTDDATASFLGLSERENVMLDDLMVQKLSVHNFSVMHRQPVIMAAEGAFHGKTQAALSVTFNQIYKVEPLPEISSVKFIEHHAEAIIESLNELHTFIFEPQFINQQWHIKCRAHLPVSCVILEPLQGEGGVIALKPEVAQSWQYTCKEHRIPLIADEIQCGMGRTGTFCFSSALGLKPDYVLLSKSLGGGMAKISVCCIAEDHYLEDFSLKHSSTFAEDEWSSRIALEALAMAVSPDIIEAITAKGRQLKYELNDVRQHFPDVIKSIRGEGLMLGIVFNQDFEFQSNMFRYLQQHNLLGYAMASYMLRVYRIRVAPTLGKNHVIRIAPSYLVNDVEIARLKSALLDLCRIIRENRADQLLLPEEFQKNIRIEPPLILSSGLKAPNIPIRKVGFVGHYVTAADIGLWDNNFSGQSEEVYEKLLQNFEPVCAPFKGPEIMVKSKEGDVLLLFIGLPLSSGQIHAALKNRNHEFVRKMVHAAVDFAIAEGCTAVGLGGFTSIITRNGKTIEHKDIHITTGNSFTVGSALAALRNKASELDISTTESVMAVVGAGGNIGSVIAELMAAQVKNLLLIGHAGQLEHLKALKERLMNNPETIATIEVTDDLFRLKDADLLATATNAAVPVIYPEMINNNRPVVICDIGVPGDLHPDTEELRPNAHIIKGGIIALPYNPDFYIPGIPLLEGHVYACMAETLLMGLENLNQHFSLGSILPDQVKQITLLARKHGFYEVVVKKQRSY